MINEYDELHTGISKVYSWVKYKVLPPSVTCKNRLLIERDSKHRRVLTSLGMTFRSSKWSDYSRPNVSTFSYDDFQLAVWKFVGIMFVMIGIDATNQFYLNNSSISEFTNMYFTVIDAMAHSLYFTIIFCFWALGKVVEWIFTSALGAITARMSAKSAVKASSSVALQVENPRLFKFRSWELAAAAVRVNSDLTRPLIERFYNSEFNSPQWMTAAPLFSELYKSMEVSKLANANTARFQVSLGETTSKDLYSSPQFSTNDTVFSNKPVTSVELSLPNTASVTYNLSSINTELSNYASLLPKSKVGMFYESNLANSELNNLTQNPNLRFLTDELSNTSTIINWHKWAYKYNILHSHILKNSHSVVLSKKLVTSTHTDNSLLSNNLWAANSVLSQTSGIAADKMMNKFTYYPYMSDNSLQSNKDVFAGYKWMEYGFFWYTKRFYFNNTLRTNQVTSLPVMKLTNSVLPDLQSAEAPASLFMLNTTTALRVSSYTNSEFNPFKKVLRPDTSSYDSANFNGLQGIKDVTLFYKHNDLFDNDNLRLLVNVSSLWTAKSSRVWSFPSRRHQNK